MSELLAALRGCRGPRDLIELAGVDAREFTSPAVAACLDAIYAVPARTREDARLWKQVSKAPWPRARARRVVACVGRRGLKSSGLLAWCMVHEALTVDWSPFVARGSRVWFPIVAPFSAQAAEAVVAVKSALDLLGGIGVRYRILDEGESPEISIRNPSGAAEIILAVKVANEASSRSFAYGAIGFDEAGKYMAQGPSSLRSLVHAMGSAQTQFQDPLRLYVGNPGVEDGLFHEYVTKRLPPGAVLIRAPSFVMNHRITRERCWDESDGDPVVFAIEHEASRFGFTGGDRFIDTTDVVYGDAFTGRGPRRGAFPICAFDIGQTTDNAAILVMTASDRDIPGSSPVRHYVVEHAEEIKASKSAPPSVEMIVSRAVEVARQWGDCPIVSDPYVRAESHRALQQRGWREHDKESAYPPGRREYVAADMSAPKQTPRWYAVRSAVAGRRFHVPDTAAARELVRQLGSLSATTLAGGALKVEGKRDDLADCAALAIDLAAKLPATAAAGCDAIEYRASMWGHWDGHELSPAAGDGWYRVEGVTGRRTPCAPPVWSPQFAAHAKMLASRGISTPEVEEWLRAQPEDVRRAFMPIPLAPAPKTLNVKVG